MPAGVVNLEEFVGWMRRRGTPDGELSACRSSAAAIIVVAHGERLTSDHITQALSRGRSAGLPERELANLFTIGNLLLRYQNEAERFSTSADAPSPTPRPLPPRMGPAPTPGLGSPMARPVEVGGALRPPLPDLLAPGPAPVAPVPREPPPAAAAEPAPAQPPPAAAVAPPARRRGRIVLAALGASALVVAAALLARDRLGPRPAVPASSMGPSAKAEPGPPRVYLPALDVRARLPPGWRTGATAAKPKTSLLFRGASAKDPEAGLYLGLLPLEGALAGRPSDEALLAAAERGHAGGVASMTARHASYRPGGCRMTTLGVRRAGMCVGTASHAGASVTVRTYVVIGTRRALLALSVGRDAAGTAAADADHILASLSDL